MSDFGSMNLTGMTLVATKTEMTVTETKLAKMADTYDEHSKLVLSIDVSGSMDCGISYEDRTSKMELVKRLTDQVLAKRFAKYPDAHVSLIEFGSSASVVFDEGKTTDVASAVSRMNANGRLAKGTNIMSAIRKSMEVCRKHPSPVGLHHFVVVSDGGDSGTYEISGWLPAMKASGITLDYIHIGNEGEINDALKNACVALGGECVSCNSATDFEVKFVKAAERLMLPAGN